MSKFPDVSVVVPVHDGEPYLADAIESVLRQRVPVREIIVVDDGSGDGSAAVAESFGPPVTCRRQAGAGAAAARNRGAASAGGEWLAFIDADDLWVDDRLERQVAAMAANPEVEVFFGHVEQFVCPTLDDTRRRAIRCPAESVPGHHPGTMLIRRGTFARTGGYDESLQVGEIVDWLARALEMELPMLMLPDVLMRRRIHRSNQGVYRRAEYTRSYLRIVRSAIERRRGPQRP